MSRGKKKLFAMLVVLASMAMSSCQSEPAPAPQVGRRAAAQGPKTGASGSANQGGSQTNQGQDSPDNDVDKQFLLKWDRKSFQGNPGFKVSPLN